MKNKVVLMLLMLAMAFTISAEESGVFMEFHRMSKPGTHTQVDRAPMRLPIEVVYDSDAQTIEVSSDSELEGVVNDK